MAATLRVDRWLWAVRIYKTRAQANDACSKGRVRVNDEVAKPATKVRVGDRVQARRKERTVIVEVVQVLEKRVGAALAAEAIVDHSPPEPEHSADGWIEAVAPTRDRGTGRPTKRDRRRLEKFRRE